MASTAETSAPAVDCELALPPPLEHPDNTSAATDATVKSQHVFLHATWLTSRYEVATHPTGRVRLEVCRICTVIEVIPV